MSEIATALISVYDKAGLESLARKLAEGGTRILSTGGTLRFLEELGLSVTSIAEYTEQEEILGGRVKTLHPRIFAGILARRDHPDDMRTLAAQKVLPIDLVVVNLYPFEETTARPDCTLDEAIEQIDIGGVSLLRAAAKNFRHVLTASDPAQYDTILDYLDGAIEPEEVADVRLALARDAFLATQSYDCAIELYLDEQLPPDEEDELIPTSSTKIEFPEQLVLTADMLQDLRYGENPHQQAAFYGNPEILEPSIARASQLQGKELSYNNILDLDAALEVVRAFEEPACCVVKHNNPCGVARHEQIAQAFAHARDCDPVSAFGGIVGFNREVDALAAEALSELFLEAVVAPSYTPDAIRILALKKNLRLLETGPLTEPEPQIMVRSVVGGMLVQTRDLGTVTRDALKVVSKAQPNDDDIDGLLFAWRVARFVKSNAIVIASRDATIGIGAGQMSRIDSTNLAAVKARQPIRGQYLASDAFFPFPDNVERAAEIGIRAIVQPGGSVRDPEVIEAADQHGLILVFTGMRHFRH